MGKERSPVSPVEPPTMDAPPPYDAPSSRSSSRISEDPLRPQNTRQRPEAELRNPQHMSDRSFPEYSNRAPYQCQKKEDEGGCMNYGASSGCMNYESRDGCMNYKSTGGCMNYKVYGEWEGNEGCLNFRRGGGCLLQG